MLESELDERFPDEISQYLRPVQLHVVLRQTVAGHRDQRDRQAL